MIPNGSTNLLPRRPICALACTSLLFGVFDAAPVSVGVVPSPNEPHRHIFPPRAGRVAGGLRHTRRQILRFAAADHRDGGRGHSYPSPRQRPDRLGVLDQAQGED